jgi:hypothetical protein
LGLFSQLHASQSNECAYECALKGFIKAAGAIWSKVGAFVTCDPVDSTSEAFEHVSGVLESVDGEEKSHDHQEQTDDREGNFSPAVI